MKGLYINVEEQEQECRRIDDLLGASTTVATGRTDSGKNVLVNYHREDWPDGPFYKDPANGILSAVSGWFVFEGKLNDLRGLVDALVSSCESNSTQEVLQGIEAGAFLLFVSTRSGDYIITDPFGLHPHYAPRDATLSRVAPSPYFLAKGLKKHPVLSRVLSKQNHLFGDHTAYEEIQRLPPGSCLSKEGSCSYFHYDTLTGELKNLPSSFGEFLDAFSVRKRILPLSGGLDSRLILALGSFDCGFTFGPPHTGDRPVARQFAHCFKDYREFSILDASYPRQLQTAAAAIFDGICDRPFVQILGIYRYILEMFGPGCVFVDGYCGDVFQRATLLTSGGIYGSLAKLFPILTTLRFDPRRLLARRYPALSDSELQLVYSVFEETTGNLDMDEMHKVLLFEIVHGKGARNALNGGTTMANQYFTAIQPFFSSKVFGILFPSSAEEKLSYSFLREIWSQAPKEFADVRTYSGYKPTWNPHLGRATMLAVKAIARTGLYKMAVDYTSELPRVNWT